jgi:hypothetical protein
MASSMHRFEDLVTLAPQHAPVLNAIRALVKDVHPETVETVRLGDRAVTWGWGPAKMKEGYVYALPYVSHVNLGFYDGAALPDAQHRLEGTGKKLRHVKISSDSELAAPEIRRLIEAARDCRRAALNAKGTR